MFYKSYLKRLIDLLLALVGFILLLPIFIFFTVLLFIVNQGKPFFYQKRPGKNEHIFEIIKFKTMTDKKDEAGQLLPDADRMTIVGNFVRKTSLDEIPQLLNVIKGDMSLIGPRPLLVEYLSLYNDFQKRRHEVRPGITGWAQVNGRNTISWKQKFEYDVWYVDNVSIFIDLKIILMTISKVVQSKDINQADQATMTKFDGN